MKTKIFYGNIPLTTYHGKYVISEDIPRDTTLSQVKDKEEERHVANNQ